MGNNDSEMCLGDILRKALDHSAACLIIEEFKRIDSLNVSDSLKQQCKEDLLEKFTSKKIPKVSEVQLLRDSGRKIDAIKLLRELSAQSFHGERIEGISLLHAKNIVERM